MLGRTMRSQKLSSVDCASKRVRCDGILTTTPKNAVAFATSYRSHVSHHMRRNEARRTDDIVFYSRTQFGEETPSLFDERTEVASLSECVEVTQGVETSNLANLRFEPFQIARFLFFVLLCVRSVGRSVVEVFEKEGHRFGQAIFEEFGQILGVEIVV